LGSVLKGQLASKSGRTISLVLSIVEDDALIRPSRLCASASKTAGGKGYGACAFTVTTEGTVGTVSVDEEHDKTKLLQRREPRTRATRGNDIFVFFFCSEYNLHGCIIV
jgi:hypothetical protein